MTDPTPESNYDKIQDLDDRIDNMSKDQGRSFEFIDKSIDKMTKTVDEFSAKSSGHAKELFELVHGINREVGENKSNIKSNEKLCQERQKVLRTGQGEIKKAIEERKKQDVADEKEDLQNQKEEESESKKEKSANKKWTTSVCIAIFLPIIGWAITTIFWMNS